MLEVPAQNFRINPADLPEETVIFGCTTAMRQVRERINRVVDSDLPVLIRGESGTGKGVMARYLHLRSHRHDSRFVEVNCAAIPGSLLESELLGNEKGAISGANEAKRGLVEIADCGTLFLDEIDTMDWSMQTKLLRLLQDGCYARIGGRRERQSHARVVCATNKNLEAAVETRAFREDLFYRIDEMGLHLLPLRERKEDIPQLCAYLMPKVAGQLGKSAPRLTPVSLQVLKQWNWPGNLRELENWIARVIVLGGEEAIVEEFRRQVALANAVDNREASIGHSRETSHQSVSAATRAVILKVLNANQGNRRRTADELNMTYRSLLSKLREMGVYQRRRSHIGLQYRTDSPPPRKPKGPDTL